MLIRLFFLLITFCHFSIFAKEEKKISACFEEWSPYAFVGKNGEATGSSIEFLQRKVKDFNYFISYKQLPHARCVELVKNKEFDFVLHVDKADGVALIEHPIADWELTLAVVPNSPIAMKADHSSNKIKLLTARGYEYPEKVAEIINSEQFEVSTASFNSEKPESIKRLFSILTSGRVDAILIDKKWADLVIAKYNINATTLDYTLHKEPQYIGYHPDNKIKAALLAKALRAN
ncbi:transporter substrate-binding domain-containing protein [Thalassotalea sp. M1531]|uniref:Transporter substrate-binding domain-containing protein n=1 Tax=Thalassotalea algicola TaxID=2716224 RepID=A0A7Y0LC46_9GAMM|nr:transporter substrate-binding domain-containing protein [Thalassotalea algicola]NMP31813.1 transporter substrate-binding domain-containing protein [Thalassotalea algicola]